MDISVAPCCGRTTYFHVALGCSTGQRSPRRQIAAQSIHVIMALGYQQGFGWWPRQQTSTWPLVVAQTAHDIVSGGIPGHIQQLVPHHSHISSSTSLHSTGNILLLFLSHLSTTYLLIIVTPPLRPLAVFIPAFVLRMAGWACAEIIFNPSK